MSSIYTIDEKDLLGVLELMVRRAIRVLTGDVYECDLGTIGSQLDIKRQVNAFGMVYELTL